MTDLQKLTKNELITRLQDLELRLDKRASQAKKRAATRRLAESALHDSEERLRAILQTAVEGIITINEQGLIESVNPAAEKTFGFKAQELIGKNVSVLMPSPYREEHDRYVSNYLRTGQAKIIGIGREVVGQRKDGTVFPMDLAVSEIRLAGRHLFTGFIRDISERKRLEKQLLEITDRERQRLGQDLHDGLCQHLAGIELMSQVLEQKLAARSKVNAARVGEIGRRVRDAISQTRLLAQGLSPVTLQSEGLMSALQELAANTEKMFEVTCRFECQSPVLVSDPASATHLYRIAQEAVSNAIKHGKATELLVKLRPAGKRILLEISDNGLGFPKDLPKSKGMGLHIMQYRAGMMGGQFSIEKKPTGGTLVLCSLPGEPAKATKQAP